MKTVVGVYDEIEDARDVVEDLVDSGIPRDDISLVARDVSGEYGTQLEGYEEDYDRDADDAAEGAAGGAVGGAVVGGLTGVLVGLGAFAIPGLGPIIAAGPIAAGLAGAGIGAVTGGLLGALVEWGIPEEEAEYYAESVRRGSTLVAARVADTEVEDVVDIMNEYDAVDIERRAEYWQEEEGWEGYDVEAEPYAASEIDAYRERRAEWDYDYEEEEEDLDLIDEEEYEAYDEDETVEVVEEDLRVGKRTETGGVRVRSYVVEEPVEEEVELREERVTVERRPVDREVDDLDAFAERTVEMTETDEEVVVDKQARVIEEIVLHKDRDTRTETVRDTVRRTEVEVEELGETETHYEEEEGWDLDLPDFEDLEDVFEEDYEQRYGTSGYTYEQSVPAYRYGYNLAADPRYRDRDWDEVEPVARERWEEHNQGTWEDFKDAVRRSWNEVKEAVS